MIVVNNDVPYRVVFNGKECRKVYYNGVLVFGGEAFIRLNPQRVFLFEQNDNKGDVFVESNTNWLINNL